MKRVERRPSMWVVGLAAVLAVTAAVVTGVALQAVPVVPVLTNVERNLRSIHVEQHDDAVGAPVDADLVLAPTTAYRMLSGGRPYQVMVSGMTYAAAPGSPRWFVSPGGPSAMPGELQLSLWWRSMTGKVVGLDGSGWHLHGTARSVPVDLWVTTGGCPVRATVTFPGVPKSGPNHPYDVHYTYTRCNQIGAITAPAASLLRGPRRDLTGGAGQRLALDGSAVTVTSVRLSPSAPDASLAQPAAGRQYLLADVRLENTTATSLQYSLAADGPGMYHEPLTPLGQGGPPAKGTLAAGQTASGSFAVQVPVNGAGFALFASVDVDSATVQLTSPDALTVTATIGLPVRLHTWVVTVQAVDLNATPSSQLGDRYRPGDRIVAVAVHLQVDPGGGGGHEFELMAGGRVYPDMSVWPDLRSTINHQVRFAVPATATGLTLVGRFGSDTLMLPL